MKYLLLVATVFLLGYCNPKTNPSASTDNSPDVDEACIDNSKVDPSIICTMEWKPVCGCDGVTYSNLCVAESNGVLRWTEGECSKE